jgi:hypothetical protein
MTSACRTILTTLIASGLSLGTAFAQDSNISGSAHPAAENEPARELTAADREQVAASLADKWRGTAEARGYRLEAWRSQLWARVLRLDNDRLTRAQQARRYDEMVEIVTGKSPARLLKAPEVLGDKSDDLSFTGITPCRIMDTRFGTGIFAGLRAAGSTTSISTSIASSIAAQGGNPAGCPELPGDAGALAYTLTVVDYTGGAFVTVFPFTAFRPNASTINMGPGTSPTPIANSSVVQQCYLCGDEVSIYVEGAATDVIIDAIGYYDPTPNSTCVASVGSMALTLSACQNYTSCALFNSSTRARLVICSAVATPSIDHVVGVHDEISMNIATSGATCAGFSTAGIGYMDVNQAVPSGCCWNPSTAAQNTFTLGAGVVQTYFLNVQQQIGTGDSMVSANLRCTLLN